MSAEVMTQQLPPDEDPDVDRYRPESLVISPESSLKFSPRHRKSSTNRSHSESHANVAKPDDDCSDLQNPSRSSQRSESESGKAHSGSSSSSEDDAKSPFIVWDDSGADSGGSKRKIAVSDIVESVGNQVENDEGEISPEVTPPNGIFLMSTDCRLQVLLTTIGAKDTFYSGLDMTPMTPDSDLSFGQGPSSFPPFDNSQPPSLNFGMNTPDVPLMRLLGRSISKDGKNSHTATSAGQGSLSSKPGGVWTLNYVDGKLFLFKSNPKAANPTKEGGMAREEEEEREGSGEGGRNGEGEKEEEGKVDGKRKMEGGAEKEEEREGEGKVDRKRKMEGGAEKEEEREGEGKVDRKRKMEGGAEKEEEREGEGKVDGVEERADEGMGHRKLVEEKAGGKEGKKREATDEDGVREMMEGVELSKLLTDHKGERKSKAYYFHLPSTILECEVDNPHLSPVYTPPSGDKYCLWKRHDSHTMGDTEWVLHHNTVFLVLDETDPNTPVINCVQEGDLKSTLEGMAQEGKSFSDAHYNPVVNIMFDRQGLTNNTAIFFTGKYNQYRYYLHVDENGKLLLTPKPVAVAGDDWKDHLEFTNSYHTPDTATARELEALRKTGVVKERIATINEGVAMD